MNKKLTIFFQYFIYLCVGWYEDNWFEANLEQEGIECTKEQMRLAAEGHLTTEALMWNQNNQRTISGMVSINKLYNIIITVNNI
jgi:gamma-aminobutyric acid type B receptor